MDGFLTDCSLRGRTQRTIEGYRSSIREFLSLFPEPQHVTKKELKTYLAKLQARGLKLSTIKGYFSAVSSFYEWLIYEGFAQVNPVLPFRARYLDRPEHPDRRQLISVEEMRQLIESIPPENIMHIAIMVFLAKTGARRGEFLGMDVHDIDFKKGIIRLPEKAKRHNRIIPMDAELFVVLEAYLDWRNPRYYYSPALWVGPRGGRIHKDDINDIIARYAKPLGLHNPDGELEDKLTCHCFRKWFTHHLTKNGMIEVYLQILRGDSLKDKAWKGNYLEPEDLINNEIRADYFMKIPQLICY